MLHCGAQRPMEPQATLAELVEPRRTALMVVDVQNDYCDPTYAPATVAMLPRLRTLVDEARRFGVQVIYTRDVQGDRWNTPVWLSRHAGRPQRAGKCLEGTPGAELHPDFPPREGDLVVVKHRYSAFVGTDLEQVLRARRIETLVFTGIATNICVESALRDAFQRDYWAVAVSDCTATFSETYQALSLEIIARNFGVVAEARELIEAWQRTAVPIPAR